jgi:hypothetical protein
MFLFVCFLVARGCLFPDVGYLRKFFYENYGSVQGIKCGSLAVIDRDSNLPNMILKCDCEWHPEYF